MNVKENVFSKNVLLLQGPMGIFFNSLRKELIENNCNVYQIAFNYGDRFFCNDKKNLIDFNLDVSEFSCFFTKIILEKKIDVIFLFGDSRKYHKIARNIINKSFKDKIKLYVFEEGYIRPNYITLEENGVNANSSKLENYCPVKFKNKTHKFDLNNNQIPNIFYYGMFYSIIYFLLLNIFHYKFKFYKHHKDISLYTNLKYGIKSFIRKYYYKFSEKKYDFIYTKSFYLVPLQVYNDFQISEHSKYNHIGEFIEEILNNYKLSGSDDFIVFKHHPMDRGFKNYSSEINHLVNKLSLSKEKIIYIHDFNLPMLLKKAKGVIVINSTVGLSALYHERPLLVMGESNYKYHKIVNNVNMIDFLKKPIKPNKKEIAKFYNYLLNSTQIYGNFYNIKNNDKII